MNNGVIDRLDDNLDLNEDGNLYIPEKCRTCITYQVCSVFPTLLAMSKLNIIVEIKECPYNKPEINKS